MRRAVRYQQTTSSYSLWNWWTCKLQYLKHDNRDISNYLASIDISFSYTVLQKVKHISLSFFSIRQIGPQGILRLMNNLRDWSISFLKQVFIA